MELRALSIATVSRNRSIFKALHNSEISDISLSVSLINLFLIYAVWLDEIKFGQFFLILQLKLMKFILCQHLVTILVSNFL